MRELINQSMLEAAKNGDLVAVGNMFDEGADILARNGEGLTALHIASQSGYKNIVDYLVIERNFPYYEEVQVRYRNADIIESRDLNPNFAPMSLAYVPVREIAGNDRQVAANIILMRGLAKTFAKTNALPRLEVGVDLNIYLNLALQAIEIIIRSHTEQNFVPRNPDRPQLNRKLEFQREALSWVSACLTIAYFKDSGLVERNPEIPFVQIRCLINIVDLVNMIRGRQHGADGIVFDAEKDVVDSFIPEILDDLPNLAIRLRYLIDQNNPAPTANQTCQNIKSLSSYYTDISILKIVEFYTNLVISQHFSLTTPINREAMLRSLEAIGEAIAVQLTPETRSLYNGLNTGALNEIRNRLDHINGDAREHRVLNSESRAVRLENLIRGYDPNNLQVLENICTNVISRIATRTNQILIRFEEARVRVGGQISHQHQVNELLGNNEAARNYALLLTKENIKQIHREFIRYPMLPMFNEEYDHLAHFLRFLSVQSNLAFGTSVIGQLKAINTSNATAWNVDASRILGLTNQQIARNTRLLGILMSLTRSINSNMEYVVKTARSLEHPWDICEQIRLGRGRYAFGTPPASVIINACIKSMEFNLINFCEHADVICKNQNFRDFYQHRYHKDIRVYFEELIFQTRNYFSHITTNKHNIDEPIDHSRAILELRNEFIDLTAKLQTVHDDMKREVQTLLLLSPNYTQETPDRGALNNWVLRHRQSQANQGQVVNL